MKWGIDGVILFSAPDREARIRRPAPFSLWNYPIQYRPEDARDSSPAGGKPCDSDIP
jgi:hypothetical protein